MRVNIMNAGSQRLVLIVFALLAGSVGLSLGARAPRAQDPFPTPSEGLVISGMGEDYREGTVLLDLLREFAAVTGEHLVLTQDTRLLLENVRVGVDRDLQVPPEEVYEVVETLLACHRFVISDLRREEPRMLGVKSLDSAARADLRAYARYVREDELPLYAEHPAILITTLVTLEFLDVRTVSNSFRGLTTDPNTQSIIPIPESRQLIVMGFGPRVVEQVEMLREMNEAAGAARAEVENEEEAKEGD